ncbi:MAG: YkvA family protein [Porphyromonas sp.]|nr:YkvA family protein [Porphyromonas sp.]
MKNILKWIRPSDLSAFRKYYKEQKLQTKVKSLTDVLGENILLPILQAYYMIKSKEVPTSQKAILIGALGYFILPIDIAPDILGVPGFLDDLAVVSLALKQISGGATKEVKAKALRTYQKLLHRTPEVE